MKYKKKLHPIITNIRLKGLLTTSASEFALETILKLDKRV
jgi:hypothetical protein